MGCGDACPIFPGQRYESWDDLDDDPGLDVSSVRPIRDDIERRVHALLNELGPTADTGYRHCDRHEQGVGVSLIS
jgi:hypothetical protein